MSARAFGIAWLLGCCGVLGFGCAGQAAQTPAEAPPAATEATQPEAPPAASPQPTAAAEPAPATPAAAVPTAPGPMVIQGFSTPESVLYDAQNDVYLVSNINGTPFDADDNGFISKVSPEGAVTELKWIDGAKDTIKLNAPKGMALANGLLYVADIDTVRKFDASTGEPKGEIAIKGATFLNDVSAAADGTVYVTDSGLKSEGGTFVSSGTDAVYKIAKDRTNAKVVIKSKELKAPNGVLADESGVWVVTFTANELYDVKDGKKQSVKTLPKGSLDGLVKTGDGKLLVSSWESSEVFRGSPSEDFAPVLSGVKSPADIGYDAKRNRVLVPMFTENAVQISPL